MCGGGCSSSRRLVVEVEGFRQLGMLAVSQVRLVVVDVRENFLGHVQKINQNAIERLRIWKQGRW
jgi:hypothetical protein